MAAKKTTQPVRAAPANVPRGVLPPPGNPDALYIVDLSGYVFRAYHAVAPLSNSKGEPTHAVYGATQMLERLVRDRRPGMLAIAMDSKAPTFRKELDARYKANRPPPPPDLSQQMQRCEEIARAYGMTVLQLDGFEADDLIATLVVRARRENLATKVVIVSADKDLMQLVDERTVLWDTMRDKVYGPAEVIEKLGVPPSGVRDLLALMGDSSDNVPGVPGVGPKTAGDLLALFHTVEAMYAKLAEGEVEGVRPKLRQTLLAAKDDAFASQLLVTLRDDVDVPMDVAAMRYKAPEGEAAAQLRALFLELEFGRLAEGVAAPRVIARSHRAITTREGLEAFAKLVRDVVTEEPAARLAVAVDATSRHPVDATILGLSFCIVPGEGVYVPLAHRYLGAPPQPSHADLRETLGAVLADPNVHKVGHDTKLVVEVLGLAGLPVHGVVFDSLLAHYLLDAEAPHELAVLAMKELGLSLEASDRASTKKGVTTPADQRSIEEATPGGAGAASAARELADRFAPRVDAGGLGALLREVELPLVEVLAGLEIAGVKVDVDRLRALSSELDAQLASLEDRARVVLRAAEPRDPVDLERLAIDFNIGSPRQLETVLFDVLGLPVQKRTKTARSTDADTLEELADRHPLPAIVLEHRSLTKLKGTYLDALPRLVSPKSGRIHTIFEQHVAATGRLSSTDPNLQNIPVRGELGQKIRAAFVAPEGMSLLSADYSQIELRVLAHLSKDPILCEAFRTGEDIHARTARELFDGSGLDPKEARRRAKAVNFGVVYGQGEGALARSLGITRDESGSFIARYFERYAGVRKYMDDQIEIARRGEGVRTLLGRRRFLPDIHSPNRALRMAAERIARNTPIQGSAADILKRAMIALRDPVVPGARMILTVHDELVFEVPTDQCARAAGVVREAMASVVPLDVPLVVDVGYGANWADAKG